MSIPRPLPYFLFSVWAGVGFFVVPLGIRVPFGGVSDLLFLIFATAVLLNDEIRSLGKRRALARFAIISFVAGSAEWFGVKTGLLFGEYVYTGNWGPLILGVLPVAVPLAWYILTIPIQRIFLGSLRPGVLIPLGALLLVVADLVLDPVAVQLRQYWIWTDGGPYYGVPLRNFLGWFLTGLAVMSVAWLTAPGRCKGTRIRARALVVFGTTVGMFGLAAAVGGLWMPALIGVPYLGLTFLYFRRGWRSRSGPEDRRRAGGPWPGER